MTGTAAATVTAAVPSVILAMHARYEAAWEQFNQLDVAGTQLDKNDPAEESLGFKYQTAELANNAETDALRQAILYQVPTTWTEAMVLLCHIHIAFDLTDKPTKEEWTATHTALDTLFDFMCCEVDQDHGALGKHFQTSANIVFDKRRYRTGIVEA